MTTKTAKNTKARKTKRAAGRRPLSRKTLQMALGDLEQRAARQLLVAESLVALVQPNGETNHGEYLIRTAIGQALERHAEGMRALSGYVDILAEDRTVRS